MIYPIYANTCAEAWLRAVTKLLDFKGRSTYNLILDIENPVELRPTDMAIVKRVDEFFVGHATDPVSTVAGTIFPAAHYKRHGAVGVYETFPEKVYPKVRSGWGDTYAGRMLRRPGKKGVTINPLEILVEKLKKQLERKTPLGRAYELGYMEDALELPIYDPALDATRTTPQPCLSHISFKVVNREMLMMTALYRSHYYMQRALGNLIGLAQLQYFAASETGLKMGELVCHSSYACLEANKKWKMGEVEDLVSDCNAMVPGARPPVVEVK